MLHHDQPSVTRHGCGAVVVPRLNLLTGAVTMLRDMALVQAALPLRAWCCAWSPVFGRVAAHDHAQKIDISCWRWWFFSRCPMLSNMNTGMRSPNGFSPPVWVVKLLASAKQLSLAGRSSTLWASGSLQFCDWASVQWAHLELATGEVQWDFSR